MDTFDKKILAIDSVYTLNDKFDSLKQTLFEHYERDLKAKDDFTKEVVSELTETYGRIEKYKARIRELLEENNHLHSQSVTTRF